jgi:hypothetical protein
LNISLNHFAQFNWGLVLVIEMPYNQRFQFPFPSSS